MKNAALIYLVCLFLCSAAPSAVAQTATKCFSADWLQGRRVVNLRVDGGRVAGTFTVESGEEDRATRTYEFTGVASGDRLTVAFADNRLPDVAPSEMRGLVWTLARDGGREVLRIKFRGKRYGTNGYEDYLAGFEPCGDEGYDSLARGAQAVRFDKGANSKSVELTSRAGFQAMREPAAFLISVARAQSLEITAEGCAIQVYLPGGKLYEFTEWEGGGEKTFASTSIDRLLIESLPRTGAYLVVLRKPAGNMRPEAVTFKATSRRR